MSVPGDEIFYLISTLISDLENIYIDYKMNGPISAEHSRAYISRGESYNIPNGFYIKIELSTDYYTLIYAL
jgi:hypothetical protein